MEFKTWIQIFLGFLKITRPKYHDKLSLQNLKVITKIALDYVNQRKYNNLVISETDTSFNLSEEDIKKYRVKWNLMLMDFL